MNSATVSGGGQIHIANDVAADPTVILGRPLNFVAVAISVTQVGMTWDALAGATQYQILRSFGGGPFEIIGVPVTNSFTDTGLTQNTTYVYQVRAADETNAGPPSNPEIATTILFTKDPLLVGSMPMRAAHVTKLRTAVNAVRAAAALAPATFTDPVLAGTPVKAIHLLELRQKLDEARSAPGLPALVYTDPALIVGGTPVRAAHIRQLRTGVR